MSRMIVIVDKPDSCIECPCSDFDKQNVCRILVRPIDDETQGLDGKPDWCPLKPIPDRIKHSIYDYDADTGYTCGWNDCLDSMIRE